MPQKLHPRISINAHKYRNEVQYRKTKQYARRDYKKPTSHWAYPLFQALLKSLYCSPQDCWIQMRKVAFAVHLNFRTAWDVKVMINKGTNSIALILVLTLGSSSMWQKKICELQHWIPTDLTFYLLAMKSGHQKCTDTWHLVFQIAPNDCSCYSSVHRLLFLQV